MNKYNGYKTIKMREFLSDYLKLSDILTEEQIKGLAKGTHRDLKDLNLPNVKTIPISKASPDDLENGNVLLVEDGKSTKRQRYVKAYIRPDLLKERGKTK